MLSHRQELSVILPYNVGQLTGCVKAVEPLLADSSISAKKCNPGSGGYCWSSHLVLVVQNDRVGPMTWDCHRAQRGRGAIRILRASPCAQTHSGGWWWCVTWRRSCWDSAEMHGIIQCGCWGAAYERQGVGWECRESEGKRETGRVKAFCVSNVWESDPWKPTERLYQRPKVEPQSLLFLFVVLFWCK